jgi:hypothetical protein
MFLFNIFSLTTFLLFILLSPGVLLTLPPGSLGVLASGQTSIVAAIIHAAVFVVLLQLINMGVTRLIFYIMKKKHHSAPPPPANPYPTPGSALPPPPFGGSEIPCDHNCGKYSNRDCLRCRNCGVCTTTKTDKETGKQTTSKRCLPGDKNGALFDATCRGPNWQYMPGF